MASEISAMATKAREMFTEGLRETFPYMKSEDLTAIVDKTIATLESGVEESQPKTEAAKARTNFFSLSPEMRNEIYELVLQPDQEATVILPGCGREKASQAKMPALLQTCKQIRAETLPMYYINKRFEACHTARNTLQSHLGTRKWLVLLGPTTGLMVKHLDIYFEMPEYVMCKLVESWLRSHGYLPRKIKKLRVPGQRKWHSPIHRTSKNEVLMACGAFPGGRLRNAEVRVFHSETERRGSRWIEFNGQSF